jgi:hypothetical protein
MKTMILMAVLLVVVAGCKQEREPMVSVQHLRETAPLAVNVALTNYVVGYLRTLSSSPE